MQKFIDKYGITFQNMNDTTGDLFTHFGMPSQPAWVFVSPDGTVNTYLGAMEEAVLDNALNDVVAGA